MSKTKLNVLVTRPIDKATVLAERLAQLEAVNQVIAAPLVSFTANPKQTLQKQLTLFQPEIIIFVSVPSVNFAFEFCPQSLWPEGAHYLAVGNATAEQLKSQKIKQISVPEKHDSEHLLTLDLLQNIENKNILIIRGDGGRELIKETLELRGARVEYAEVYQRCWSTLPLDTADQWKNQQINCIVITSNEMLNRFHQLTTNDNNYWCKQLIIVVSKRIEQSAQALGYQQIIIADGASEQAIINAINMSGSGNDK
jgi:uroporphyrinogen-III synthase